MSAAQAVIARRAAEIVQERGHCKGNFSDLAGRVCLWGALREAVKERNENVFSSPHLEPFRRRLRDMFPQMAMSPWPGSEFNDDPGTTEQDVAKVLLQLADRLELAP